MNSIVGKSTGIALLMAAAMLAALFAMGVFSATGVGATGTAPAIQDATADVTVGDADAEKGFEFFLETGTLAAADSPVKVGTISATIDGDLLEAEAADDGSVSETVVYQLTPANGIAPDVPATLNDDNAVVDVQDLFAIHPLTGALTFTGTTVDSDEFDDTVQVRVWAIRALKTAVANGPDTYDDPTVSEANTSSDAPISFIPYRYATDEKTAGASVRLEVLAELSSATEMTASDDTITVKLASFGVPSSIDAADVDIRAGSNINVKASDVDISGTTVTIYVGRDSVEASVNLPATDTTIVFRQGAGITLPIRDGSYDISVGTEAVSAATTADVLVNRVKVEREVSVSPTSGTRGTEVTITGKGFADGTADIKIGDDVDFTTAEVDDGAFSITVDTAAKVNDVNVFGSAKTTINVSDAVGNPAKDDAEFEIKPSFTIDPENPLSGADITITLIDIDVPPTTQPKVTFAGDTDNAEYATEVTTTTANDWKATVPNDARIGTIQVKIEVEGADALTQNITIGTNDLTINPSTVVPRQEISLDGGGFTSSDDGTTPEKENTIGVNAVMFGETAANHVEQPVNNSGNISFNVQVPDSVTPGTVKVSVQDVGGRVGVATITVLKPEITLNPAESLIGSEVTVSGTGFPANDLVLIKYGGKTVDTAPTTSTGTFEQVITVPSGNNPGDDPEVEAVAQVQDVIPDNKASATTKHALPDAVIILSPTESTAGSTLTINGANFKGFLQVFKIEVGGQNVTPGACSVHRQVGSLHDHGADTATDSWPVSCGGESG